MVIPYVVTRNVIPSATAPPRDMLLYFNGYRSSSPTRSNLLNAYRSISDADVEIVDKDRGTNLIPHAEYVKKLQRSRFCLVVRGDTSSSRRLFEAIVAGCLPVILSEGLELPFERRVDYASFAYFPSEMEAVMNPKGYIQKLRSIGDDELVRKQQAMAAVAHHFVYGAAAADDAVPGAESAVLEELCAAKKGGAADGQGTKQELRLRR